MRRSTTRQLIFPERMHGVAGSGARTWTTLPPVEKLCMLCERGHVPCHTFYLPRSRQSARIPRWLTEAVGGRENKKGRARRSGARRRSRSDSLPAAKS